MIASLDNPEYPAWPTLLVIALFLIVMFGSLALFAPHSQRHKHARTTAIVLCAERCR